MRRFLAVILLLAGPAFWGTPERAFSAPPRVKIGFLVKMPEESWFQREWQFAERAGHDLGFDVVKMGVTDGQKVLDALGILAAQGAQGFVICSPDVRLGPAIAAQAKAKNMKFLAVDDQLLGVNQKPMVPYFGIAGAGMAYLLTYLVYLGVTAFVLRESLGVTARPLHLVMAFGCTSISSLPYAPE